MDEETRQALKEIGKNLEDLGRFVASSKTAEDVTRLDTVIYCVSLSLDALKTYQRIESGVYQL
jgi:hypothetical protein